MRTVSGSPYTRTAIFGVYLLHRIISAFQGKICFRVGPSIIGGITGRLFNKPRHVRAVLEVIILSSSRDHTY